MMDIVGGVLIGLGALLLLLASVGLLRFPDVFTRSSASTKAAGLGVALLFAGTGFVIGTAEAAVKMTLAIVMQFITAPVAGHVIGRAAYRAGTPLYEGTVRDELDPDTPRRPATK